MGLVTATFFLSLVMLFGCALPLCSSWARRHSVSCLLFGTGAMLGICLFAILPEIVQAGGPHTLWLVAIAGVLYSWLHLHHFGHHHHDHSEHGHRHGDDGQAMAVGVLLASMSLHCFADGLVLAVSFALSASLARAIVFALFAHKFYEAFSVSALLREKAASLPHFLFLLAVYAISLPIGVAAGWCLPGWLSGAPVMIMSLALGGLLSCLWHDFLVPSLTRIQQRRRQAGWILLGLLLSSLLRGGG